MTTNTMCACGCNTIIVEFDKKGRKRSYATGHANFNKIKEYILPSSKICNRCNKLLDISKFGLHKSYSKISGESIYRPRSRCCECESIDRTEYAKTNPDKIKRAADKYHDKNHGTIKYHVQEKISSWKKASIVQSDLTCEYLIDLYNHQNGCCHYSGEKMIFGWVNGKPHHNSISLDKLDPAKGYVQGNVVWCGYLVNTMKQNMTEEQFYTFIGSLLKRKENNEVTQMQVL